MELRVAAAKSKKILRTKIRCTYFFFFLQKIGWEHFLTQCIYKSSRFLENGVRECSGVW